MQNHAATKSGRRHGREFWEKLIAEKQRDGLTMAQVAKRYGVGKSTVSRWVGKLKDETAPTPQNVKVEQKPKLVELVTAQDINHAAACYVIRSGRFAVEVAAEFDDRTLVRLLKAVAAC